MRNIDEMTSVARFSRMCLDVMEDLGLKEEYLYEVSKEIDNNMELNEVMGPELPEQSVKVLKLLAYVMSKAEASLEDPTRFILLSFPFATSRKGPEFWVEATMRFTMALNLLLMITGEDDE